MSYRVRKIGLLYTKIEFRANLIIACDDGSGEQIGFLQRRLEGRDEGGRGGERIKRRIETGRKRGEGEGRRWGEEGGENRGWDCD